MHFLRLWPALILLGLLSQLSAQTITRATANAGTGNPAGTWLTLVTPDPNDPDAPAPFSSLITFTADGNLYTTETDEQTISQGVWAISGHHQVSLTAFQFEFDAPNVWGGTFKIRAKLTLDNAENYFNGPYRVDFFDPKGNFLFSGVGSLAGTRIHLESLP
jgi:hypothetical protein